MTELSDSELLRYSRQVMLDEFDVAGQQALLQRKVAVVGLGGLGSPVAMYLASAGVGSLVLCDFDAVDSSNLQRQILHGETDVGAPKTDSAAQAIHAINAGTAVETICEKLGPENLEALVAGVDLVVDCSDNLALRVELNRSCQRLQRPLVSGAAIRWQGQVTVFDFREQDIACYQCLYPGTSDVELNCATSGVIAPLLGVIGSMQALECIKLLVGAGEPLQGRLLMFDGLYGEWQELRVNRNPECPLCSLS